MKPMRTEFKTALIKRLGQVAVGQEPADLILTGGDVLNVYTGELLRDYQILIAGERIAYVGPEKNFPRDSQTTVIDVNGNTVIPGLIDAHCHMDVWMKLREYAYLSLPRGTTTVITECSAATNAMGIRGTQAFLKQFPNSPQRVFATAPSISFLCAERGDGQRVIGQREMMELLEKPEVLGLGEIYWFRILEGGEVSEELLEMIRKAKTLGKTAEGHGAGAKNRKLAAMVASGIEACHEAITAEEVRDRLRLGLDTMIREGSIRRELEAVVGPLVEMNLDLQRAMLVSDNVWPHHLI